MVVSYLRPWVVGVTWLDFRLRVVAHLAGFYSLLHQVIRFASLCSL